MPRVSKPQVSQGRPIHVTSTEKVLTTEESYTEVSTREASIKHSSTEEWSTDELFTDEVSTDESPGVHHTGFCPNPFEDDLDLDKFARDLLISFSEPHRHFDEIIESSANYREDGSNNDWTSTLLHTGNIEPSILSVEEEMLASTVYRSNIITSEVEGAPDPGDYKFLEEVSSKPFSSTNFSLPLEGPLNIPVSSSEARTEIGESWLFPQALEMPEVSPRTGSSSMTGVLAGSGTISPQLALDPLSVFLTRQGPASNMTT